MRGFAVCLVFILACKNEPDTGVFPDTDPTDTDATCDESTWYVDADEDGFGAEEVLACEAPAGASEIPGDCDDADPAVNPAAADDCNGVDDDCDGTPDDDAPSWYADADQDGYGDPGAVEIACTAPEGYVAEGNDCDDTDPAVTTLPWFADGDGDGFGDAGDEVEACTQPGGYVADATDCDDAAPASHPGAPEVCGGLDEDCDGTVDEDGAEDAPTWFADADADGYGDLAATAVACDAPAGFVADASDCDDASGAVNPGAAELCNTFDDDCDGATDEIGAADAPTWYADTDADGYGDLAATTAACSAPSGYVASATDCDDTRALTNPGATEYCNAEDDDCDGTTDEADAADASTWYGDADADGYGTSATTTKACSAPSGYVASATDCDDARALSNPAATEYCNTYDDDCDGAADEDDAADAPTWYQDADLDGYGGGTTKRACSLPSGYAAAGDDCDDADAYAFPGAPELCDGARNDCDLTAWTSADEDLTVSHVTTAGAWVDVTVSVVEEPTYELPASGTVYFCDGEYFVGLSHAGGTIHVIGRNGSASTIINGAAVQPALEITGSTGTVTLEGMTFTNGIGHLDGSRLGGAVYSELPLVLEDVVFSDSTADYGGGLYAEQEVTGDGVVFSGNTATADGGGLYAAGGEISLTGAELSDNSADGYGGGLHSAYPLTLVDTLVATNASGEDGAGLYFHCSAGDCPLDLDGVTFSGNASSDEAGGLFLLEESTYATRTPYSIVGSVFDGNTSAARAGGMSFRVTKSASKASLAVSDTSFTANVAGQTGGAMYVLTGAVSLTSVDLTGNEASDGGGGLHVYDGDLTGSELTVSDNVVTGTTASTYYRGGGIWVQGYNGTVALDDSAVSGNTVAATSVAYSLGGGLYLEAPGTFTSTTFSGNSAGAGGGLYYAATGAATASSMSSSHVSSNTAIHGGGIFVNQGTLSCSGSTSVTSGVMGNTASLSGGGVYIGSSFATYKSSSCDFGSFFGNNTDASGAADIYVYPTRYNYATDVSFTCTSSGCS